MWDQMLDQQDEALQGQQAGLQTVSAPIAPAAAADSYDSPQAPPAPAPVAAEQYGAPQVILSLYYVTNTIL